MKIGPIGLALALLASPVALAQGAYTVEELSEIRDFETAAMDSRSIASLGNDTRFEVHVRWRDPEQRPPTAPVKRVIRFLAKCKEKTLGVIAVVTFDDQNRMMKNYLIPPGASDFVPVKEGSREERWLKEVCY